MTTLSIIVPCYNEEIAAPLFFEACEAEVRKLGGLTLKAGMPVETYMQTQRRTLMSYLVKPLIDQFNRAFRQ